MTSLNRSGRRAPAADHPAATTAAGPPRITRPALRLGVVMAVGAALVVAGCGGSSGGSSSGSSGVGSTAYAGSSGGGSSGGYRAAPTSAGSTGAGTASVGIATSSLGRILVDGHGRTLYLFEGDKGSASQCSGSCAMVWPPLTSSHMPSAKNGVQAAKLGTAKRSDGTSGVTYNGHPLYTYSGDTAPGTVTGEGSDDFGAHWYVVSPAGAAVRAAS